MMISNYNTPQYTFKGYYKFTPSKMKSPEDCPVNFVNYKKPIFCFFNSAVGQNVIKPLSKGNVFVADGCYFFKTDNKDDDKCRKLYNKCINKYLNNYNVNFDKKGTHLKQITKDEFNKIANNNYSGRFTNHAEIKSDMSKDLIPIYMNQF